MKTFEVVITENFPGWEALKNFRSKGLKGHTRKKVPCLNPLQQNERIAMTKRKNLKDLKKNHVIYKGHYSHKTEFKIPIEWSQSVKLH